MTEVDTHVNIQEGTRQGLELRNEIIEDPYRNQEKDLKLKQAGLLNEQAQLRARLNTIIYQLAENDEEIARLPSTPQYLSRAREPKRSTSRKTQAHKDLAKRISTATLSETLHKSDEREQASLTSSQLDVSSILS